MMSVGCGLVGANQDRRRSEDRSCARHDTAVIGSSQNCEQRQCSRRSSPRGVSEAALAGRVATEARHSFNSGDGLGIHHLGSNGQGRARDRAICPAVTRNRSDVARSAGNSDTRQASVSRAPAAIRSRSRGAFDASNKCRRRSPGPREALSNLIAYPFGGGE